MKLAKSEMAPRDERAHAKCIGQAESLTVASFGNLDVGGVAIGCNLAKQAEGICLITTLFARARKFESLARGSDGIFRSVGNKIGGAQPGEPRATGIASVSWR